MSKYVDELFDLSARIRFHDLDGDQLTSEIERVGKLFDIHPDAVRSGVEERVELDREYRDQEQVDESMFATCDED
jgi:hypothetical protein